MPNTYKEFRVGQKVHLNSGSPALTVVATGDRTTVEWQNGESMETCTLPSACFTAVL